MNTGLRPLPASLPFVTRCDLMVKRGEAKSISEASRMLRTGRHNYGTVAVAKLDLPIREVRLPYADN